jgi:leucyl aminopeptidase
MRLRAVAAHPWDVPADVLAFPVLEDAPVDGELGALDEKLDGALTRLRGFGELSGRLGATTLFPTSLPCGYVLAVGLGPAIDDDARIAAHRFGAQAVRRLGGRTVQRLALWLGDDPATSAELISRGVVEGDYDPGTRYRGSDLDEPPAVIDEVILVAAPGTDDNAIAAAGERGRIVGEGTNLARDLSNRAANDLNPAGLADEASALARKHDLAVEIIGPDEAAKMGMGLFTAVGRGSDNPPRFIVLRSGEAPRGGSGDGARSGDGSGRYLALVGKGVTFDSGGISIKSADRMSEMKMDKTGAATVIAAIATAARLRPGVPLLAVAPAVENMPGPHSTRPGDVVRALNGKVVEIDNTDAEGRLILGDALVYAERAGATHLVDVATLTGASERIFGKAMTPAFGTPQAWFDEVADAGRRVAERYWQMPLIDEYLHDMETSQAELSNSGPAEGSFVKSGLFLSQFATRPWVHLDIGGSGYYRRPTPWAAAGASGETHATLVELALSGD